MDDFYCRIPLSEDLDLCLGPLTRREADSASASFCDGTGTYLFLRHGEPPNREIDVIARIVSVDAAARLRDALIAGTRAAEPQRCDPRFGEAQVGRRHPSPAAAAGLGGSQASQPV
jgi:hypothetical protein